jgi:hypothetical protein
LARLRDSGVLTEREFESLKDRLIRFGQGSTGPWAYL